MVSVVDNRNLQIAQIQFQRHPDNHPLTDVRITRHHHDSRGFLQDSRDPRLDDSKQANFTWLNDLNGNRLRTQGVDSGSAIALGDIAGRPLLAVTQLVTDVTGKDDYSQAVTFHFWHEPAGSSGRLLGRTDQAAGETPRWSERFVYTELTPQAASRNVAGLCTHHYHTAGMLQVDRVALTGGRLSITQRLLLGADDPALSPDWKGDDAEAWNTLLEAPDQAHTTLATCDATGSQLTSIDACGNVQQFAYDLTGRLSGSWLLMYGQSPQPIVQSLIYAASGEILSEKHGNGVWTQYLYEARTQRLVEIHTQRTVRRAGQANLLQYLHYDYDPVGNVASVKNDAQATRYWRNQQVLPRNTYRYDSLYQLVEATGREMANRGQQGIELPPVGEIDEVTYSNYTRSYIYDTAGNLERIRHSAPASNSSYSIDITVSDRSNRAVLSTLANVPELVDAQFSAGGHQHRLQPGQALGWTPRGELQSVTPVIRDNDQDDLEHYRYGADSQRLVKIRKLLTAGSLGMRQVRYLPGLELRSTTVDDTVVEDLQMILIGQAGQSQVRVLHWVQGQPAEVGNDQTRYSYDDGSGNSSLEVDGRGNIISLEEYYPYGGTAILAGRNQVEASYKAIRYSGKECDATGLYYYGFRYYQPLVCRWLSADPAGTADGLNLYRMVSNNPATLVDDHGLMGKKKKKEPAPLVLQGPQAQSSSPPRVREDLHVHNLLPHGTYSAPVAQPLPEIQVVEPASPLVLSPPPVASRAVVSLGAGDDEGFTTVSRRGSNSSQGSGNSAGLSGSSRRGSGLISEYAITGDKNFERLKRGMQGRLDRLDNLHAIARTPRSGAGGRFNYFFIDNDKNKTGLAHICEGYKVDEYAKVGVTKSQIIPLIMEALLNGEEVTLQNPYHKDGGRPIYKVEFNGGTQYVAITLSRDEVAEGSRFIVGANASTEGEVEHYRKMNEKKKVQEARHRASRSSVKKSFGHMANT